MSYLLNLIFNLVLSRKLNLNKALFARKFLKGFFVYSIEVVSFDKTRFLSVIFSVLIQFREFHLILRGKNSPGLIIFFTDLQPSQQDILESWNHYS